MPGDGVTVRPSGASVFLRRLGVGTLLAADDVAPMAYIVMADIVMARRRHTARRRRHSTYGLLRSI